MSAWVKAVVAVVVMLLPGALLALVAYAWARAFQARWREAREQANGKAVPVRAVLAQVHLRDVLRQTRLVS